MRPNGREKPSEASGLEGLLKPFRRASIVIAQEPDSVDQVLRLDVVLSPEGGDLLIDGVAVIVPVCRYDVQWP